MRLVLALIALACLPAFGADRLVGVETRPGVKVSYWLMERPGATLTVALLPGGEGGIGMRDGVPASQNFLIRSRDYFAAAGFNVALIGKPTDRQDLDPAFRSSADHVTDLRIVVEKLRADLKMPVWLVGTSRGTISAAAAGIALDPSMLAGIVLTSSITDGARSGPVTNLALDNIRVPVLVMHHKRDECRSCNPRLADVIVSRLTNAPVKKLILVDGGAGARGDPCEPLHWHGYIGMEKEAVELITAWIRKPVP